MENKLQPIHLLAQELVEKAIELANYKVAYENLLNENKELKKENEELKNKTVEEVKDDER